jgi:hypothetical protein
LQFPDPLLNPKNFFYPLSHSFKRTIMPGKFFLLLLLSSILSLSAFSQQINIYVIANSVFIDWSEEGHEPVDHYEVERRMSDGEFRLIGLVLPDDVADLKQYRFKEKLTTGSEKLYYRIKTIRTNGSETFSSIAKLSIDEVEKGLVTIVPDTQLRTMTVQLPAVNGSYVFRIYNINGRLLYSESSEARQPAFSIERLSAGDYFMEAFHPQTGKRYYGKFRI